MGAVNCGHDRSNASSLHHIPCARRSLFHRCVRALHLCHTKWCVRSCYDRTASAPLSNALLKIGEARLARLHGEMALERGRLGFAMFARSAGSCPESCRLDLRNEPLLSFVTSPFVPRCIPAKFTFKCGYIRRYGKVSMISCGK